jgi:hypothetical protein
MSQKGTLSNPAHAQVEIACAVATELDAACRVGIDDLLEQAAMKQAARRARGEEGF